MSNTNIENLDHELLGFQSSVSIKQWNDPVFLCIKAAKMEDTNLALAFWLVKRANKLNPLSPKIKTRLMFYKELLEGNNPEFFRLLNQKNVLIKSPPKIIENDTVKSEMNSTDKNTENNAYVESEDEKIDSTKTPSQETIESVPVDDEVKFPLFIFQSPLLRRPIVLLVVIPWLLFCFYEIFLVSDRYESQAQLIVKQPDDMAAMDASMALLSGLGVPTTSTDTKLVEAYINSMDMLIFLNQELDLKEHYSNDERDIFSRFNNWNSQEDFLIYYQDHISVEIDDTSSIITIKAQGYTTDFANKLNNSIVKRAEWYINNIGHALAKEQLKFIEQEHAIVATRLAKDKSNLLQFQQDNKLLDPTTEGAAFQQIAYNLEATISSKKAELYALEAIMSESSPQVSSLRRVIFALEEQLKSENTRLSGNDSSEELTVGEKMSLYSSYKINLELSLQAYASSLVSLEKARIEAYRQLQFLVVVETPTFPESNKYPEVIYNITLFGVVFLLIFGVGNIIVATIKELN